MSPDALQDLVKQCLEAFYTRRINNLSGLRLKDAGAKRITEAADCSSNSGRRAF